MMWSQNTAERIKSAFLFARSPWDDMCQQPATMMQECEEFLFSFGITYVFSYPAPQCHDLSDSVVVHQGFFVCWDLVVESYKHEILLAVNGERIPRGSVVFLPVLRESKYCTR